MSKETVIKFDHVTKEYRLGEIGGGTLRGDLQSWWAKKTGKEDPNSKVGSKKVAIGEKFLALDDISFEIKKGEAVGIIGHNGAGKSTLLKLLCRVTGPTKGTISYNGRVASMLEVGTGFHPEMTGRENIYMNGAILGMTKSEIDAKIEDIIDFSEVRDFIDTPVKRYSSGMYVKLAFSVAAHLDSEIMIMDEVLAVGDMAFQKKCLTKMREAADKEGRTILYVSHNMNTIKQLCDRCIVLDRGKVVFNGDVNTAIEQYVGSDVIKSSHYDYTYVRHANSDNGGVLLKSLDIINNLRDEYQCTDTISIDVTYDSIKSYKELLFRCELSVDDQPIGSMITINGIEVHPGYKQHVKMDINLAGIMSGHYRCDLIAFIKDDQGMQEGLDGVYPAFFININNKISQDIPVEWLHQYWGRIKLTNMLLH